MSLELNCDSLPIKNWEITPEGYMKLWIAVATANHDLVYDSRTEFIAKDNLLNKDSINSAIGKHLTFNHPPQAITSGNWNQYAVGSVLQEYAEDGDNLLMASMVYDRQVIDGIKSGKYKNVSAGYSAVKKEINEDGKIEQLQRAYNHFAILDQDHEPRAGKTCSVRVFDMPNKDSKNKTSEKETANSTDSNKESKESFVTNKLDVAELIGLHSQYDSVLKEKGKEPDFSMDSTELKRNILYCFYPEEQIKKLSDSNLDGFWINFELNKELILDAQEKVQTRNQEINNDGGSSSARNSYIALLENRPK
jgi:Uncharacterized protein conserved in bacteria (DUF2213)